MHVSIHFIKDIIHVLSIYMLTKHTLWKGQEALALKKRDSEGTLSEVNVTSVIPLLQ